MAAKPKDDPKARVMKQYETKRKPGQDMVDMLVQGKIDAPHREEISTRKKR